MIQLQDSAAVPETADGVQPLRLELDVEKVFGDFGVFELYIADSADAASALRDARTAVCAAYATLAEKRLCRAIQESAHHEPQDSSSLVGQLEELSLRVIARGRVMVGPLVDELAAAEIQCDLIGALWEADKLAYSAAYAAAAQGLLADRGLDHLQLEVGETLASRPRVPDPLVEELESLATQTALLPMTGMPPDWTWGAPADALRRRGATYIRRARALKNED